jgi:hypothetical protein
VQSVLNAERPQPECVTLPCFGIECTVQRPVDVEAKAAQDAQGRRQAGSLAEGGDGFSGGTPIGVRFARPGVQFEPKGVCAESIALRAAVLTFCGLSTFWVMPGFLVTCTSVIGRMSGPSSAALIIFQSSSIEDAKTFPNLPVREFLIVAT